MLVFTNLIHSNLNSAKKLQFQIITVLVAIFHYNSEIETTAEQCFIVSSFGSYLIIGIVDLFGIDSTINWSNKVLLSWRCICMFSEYCCDDERLPKFVAIFLHIIGMLTYIPVGIVCFINYNDPDLVCTRDKLLMVLAKGILASINGVLYAAITFLNCKYVS